jgi:hypothetical protein
MRELGLGPPIHVTRTPSQQQSIRERNQISSKALIPPRRKCQKNLAEAGVGNIVSVVFTPVLTKRARRGRTVVKAVMARLRSAREWPERFRRLSPGSKKSRILRTRGTVMVKTCTGGKVIIHFAASWLRRPRSNKRITLSGAAKICFRSGCFICSVTARDSRPSSGAGIRGKKVRSCRGHVASEQRSWRNSKPFPSAWSN